jgi:hypothetical protein
MNQAKIDLRIGELLIESGILTTQDLEQAIKTAEATSLPVGRVLVMAGFLTDTEFQAAVQAQSLVRDSLMPLDVAVKVLKLVTDQRISFQEALDRSGYEQPEDKESNKLGELLLAAKVVPRDQLDLAMRTSTGTGLPLGRLLISLGHLSDEMLASSLLAQQMIRAGKISRAAAIEGLVAAYERRKPVEKVLTEMGFYNGPRRSGIRLGELLVKADLLLQDEVNKALEAGLIEKKWFGQVLVDGELIDAEMLDCALQIQEMVANETIDVEGAVSALRELHAIRCTLPEALAILEVAADQSKSRVSYLEVMKVAGLINPADQNFGMDVPFIQTADVHRTARMLMTNGIIDERVYLGSLRCFYLISSGWLNMQQGIIALNYFHHKKGSFDDVLFELRWAVHTYSREDDLEDQTAGAQSGAQVR